MTATFLVTATVSSRDPSILQTIADQIKDSLEFDSIPVIAVAPWQSHDNATQLATDSAGPLDQAALPLF